MRNSLVRRFFVYIRALGAEPVLPGDVSCPPRWGKTDLPRQSKSGKSDSGAVLDLAIAAGAPSFGAAPGRNGLAVQ